MIAYDRALERLYERTGGAWRLGLERVTGLLELLGYPHSDYPVFHIAGTNGKGSTVATLDAILQGSGLRTARYTSPHLVDFNERIAVNGKPMSHEAIAAWLERWDDELTTLGATFFEATTAMALAHFAQQKVDVAIVEVGLGGKLDATNIVSPIAAAVTQIGLDHMEYLGTTVAAIAGEKAGIFKADRPAVIGDTRAEIRDFLVSRAVEAGATPVLSSGVDWFVSEVDVQDTGTSFTLEVGGTARRLSTPLVGDFQAHNCAVALAMLRGAGGPWREIESRAASLLGAVSIAGRFHRSGPWLFDVAHNADGATALAASLMEVHISRPIVAIVCVLRDKDWRGILTALASVADRIIVTMAPTAPASRAWLPEEVAAWIQETGIGAQVEWDFPSALSIAAASGGTIVVTGSFHTVGDAMERLQVNPLAR